MTTEFIWPIRVYYEDTDAGGVVYYANYLNFYERARTEWLNHLKINQNLLLVNNRVFVVVKAEVDYIKPAKLNDHLIVQSQISRLSAVSVEFEQKIYKEISPDLIANGNALQKDKTLLNKAFIKVACLKLNSFTPCRMPANVREEFQRVS